MVTKRAGLNVETVLREIEALSQIRFLPIIGPVKGKYLVDTVNKYKVSKVLEIGTLIGYSAILIAKSLPDEGRISTIEINPQSARTAQENIAKAGLADKVQVHIGNALQVIPKITSEEFDMIFIDAAKTEYFEYLKLSEPHLKKNGVIFADNVKIFADQMKDFLNYLRNSGKYNSQYIDVGFDGVEISQKLF